MSLETQQAKIALPSDKTIITASKLSLKYTKPLDFYFYTDSCKGNLFILSDNDDMIIYKNEDEYTSPILKTFKNDNEYIVITENTIYVISSKTPMKNLNDGDLDDD